MCGCFFAARSGYFPAVVTLRSGIYACLQFVAAVAVAVVLQLDKLNDFHLIFLGVEMVVQSYTRQSGRPMGHLGQTAAR